MILSILSLLTSGAAIYFLMKYIKETKEIFVDYDCIDVKLSIVITKLNIIEGYIIKLARENQTEKTTESKKPANRKPRTSDQKKHASEMAKKRWEKVKAKEGIESLPSINI